MKTSSNYYRIILETVWNYSPDLLDTMTDEDCENEYQIVGSLNVNQFKSNTN